MEKEINLKGKFKLGFHGSFIPLQGVEYILGAAEILKEEHRDIVFLIVGDGQTYKEMRALAAQKDLDNVSFLGRFPLNELPQFILSCDVCLGIFGSSRKTDRVIPNKVYEYIALGKPVISADTPAIREFFSDNQDIALCKKADSLSLSKKIIDLKSNSNLRSNIARNCYKLYKKHCTPKTIVSELLQKI